MKNPPIPPDTPTTANERYLVKSLGTWSSISDVDVFLSRFTHANDYRDGDVELSLGNFVTIQDGTYNVDWVIAGFDMEYKQTSADGNKYDNGLGICMIPQTHVTATQWNGSYSAECGYKSSTINTTHIPGIVTKLQNVLGSHIVNRNVLLSSSAGEKSSTYTWTTAYATLMSVGQMTGKFASYSNKYDDGEANYKLPIFNSKEYKTGYNFWTRGIGTRVHALLILSNGNIDSYDQGVVNRTFYVRPLIYLR